MVLVIVWHHQLVVPKFHFWLGQILVKNLAGNWLEIGGQIGGKRFRVSVDKLVRSSISKIGGWEFGAMFKESLKNPAGSLKDPLKGAEISKDPSIIPKNPLKSH